MPEVRQGGRPTPRTAPLPDSNTHHITPPTSRSLDNAIKVYASEGRFQENRKKKFTGHQVAGFACEMTFSPSGKFLASGDGNGRLYFWDWNTGRSYARFNAHQRGPTMGCQWSPVDPSLVVTCGWDGSVKFWSNTIVKKK